MKSFFGQELKNSSFSLPLPPLLSFLSLARFRIRETLLGHLLVSIPVTLQICNMLENHFLLNTRSSHHSCEGVLRCQLSFKCKEMEAERQRALPRSLREQFGESTKTRDLVPKFELSQSEEFQFLLLIGLLRHPQWALFHLTMKEKH